MPELSELLELESESEELELVLLDEAVESASMLSDGSSSVDFWLAGDSS